MESRPVRIYASADVPRLRYIAGIILGDILGLVWEIITDKRKLGKHPVINYSDENLKGSFKISPDSLLFESGISPREIGMNDWKGLPVFFGSSSDSDLPFDIFAASFYLVSRYEEYQGLQTDECGRFRASSSLASRKGFLGIPVVELWTKQFAKEFLKRFQNLTFKRNEFRALLTVEADQPFAYLGKSILGSIGGILRDLKKNDGHVAERYRIVVKGEKDPYEVFDYISDTIERHRSDARFFFPVGDSSKFDKNPSWKNEEYRKLILRIAEKHKTGLHSSYYASENPDLINSEKARLRSILNKEIIFNLFHYIRLLTPQSYSGMLKAGFTEDYSMGYPEEPGFRAGLARPFYFYDVAGDQQTCLKIVPFQIMDWTLCKYKNLGTSDSKEVISGMISEIRKVGGTFVSIWHNTSLLDNPDWKGWREVFEFMLKCQMP